MPGERLNMFFSKEEGVRAKRAVEMMPGLPLRSRGHVNGTRISHQQMPEMQMLRGAVTFTAIAFAGLPLFLTATRKMSSSWARFSDACWTASQSWSHHQRLLRAPRQYTVPFTSDQTKARNRSEKTETLPEQLQEFQISIRLGWNLNDQKDNMEHEGTFCQCDFVSMADVLSRFVLVHCRMFL